MSLDGKLPNQYKVYYENLTNSFDNFQVNLVIFADVRAATNCDGNGGVREAIYTKM